MSYDAAERLGKAISTPVATMTVVSVESAYQANDLIRSVTPRLGDRPWAILAMTCVSGQTATLLKKSRETVASWPPEAGVLFLLDTLPPNRRPEEGVKFWRAMNLQRENWSGLNCHLVFLLTLQNYEQLLTEADHLASWIPIKLDAHRPTETWKTQEFMMEYSSPSGQRQGEARQRLEELERGLAEFLSGDDAPNPTLLLRRYYLPMMEAALDINDFAHADSIRTAVDSGTIPEADKPRWWKAVCQTLQHLYRADEMRREAKQYLDWAKQTNNLQEQGGALNWLSIALSLAGRREEALEAAQETETLYRELSEKNPDAFLPDLAGALNNLGKSLSYVGRREEALNATQETEKLYRELAEENRDAFLPALATALNNLGNGLSGMSRCKEALVAAREAVDLHRELVAKNRDAFLPDLASALNNLGNRLSGVGRHEEALLVTQEAVDIRRELSEKNPDAFLPALAGALNNLGTCFSAVGRREEALEAVQEAIDIYRKLSEKNPDAFLPDLAMSMGAMGRIYQNTGDVEQAHSCFEKGIAHLLPLFERHPAAFARLMGGLVRDAVKTAQAESAELSDTTMRAKKLLAAFVKENPPQ